MSMRIGTSIWFASSEIAVYYYWDRDGVVSSRYQGMFVFIVVAVVVAEA